MSPKVGSRSGTSRTQRAAKPSSSARRASRSWSRIVGVSPANASMGKKTPRVSRPGANIARNPRDWPPGALFALSIIHPPKRVPAAAPTVHEPRKHRTQIGLHRSRRRDATSVPDIQIKLIRPQECSYHARTGHGEGRIRSISGASGQRARTSTGRHSVGTANTKGQPDTRATGTCRRAGQIKRSSEHPDSARRAAGR